MTMFTGCICARLLWFKLGMSGRQNHGSPKISKSKSLEPLSKGTRGGAYSCNHGSGRVVGDDAQMIEDFLAYCTGNTGFHSQNSIKAW